MQFGKSRYKKRGHRSVNQFPVMKLDNRDGRNIKPILYSRVVTHRMNGIGSIFEPSRTVLTVPTGLEIHDNEKCTILLTTLVILHLDSYVCGLLISQQLPCPQPSELLLDWQSC